MVKLTSKHQQDLYHVSSALIIPNHQIMPFFCNSKAFQMKMRAVVWTVLDENKTISNSYILTTSQMILKSKLTVYSSGSISSEYTLAIK